MHRKEWLVGIYACHNKSEPFVDKLELKWIWKRLNCKRVISKSRSRWWVMCRAEQLNFLSHCFWIPFTQYHFGYSVICHVPLFNGILILVPNYMLKCTVNTTWYRNSYLKLYLYYVGKYMYEICLTYPFMRFHMPWQCMCTTGSEPLMARDPYREQHAVSKIYKR